MPDNDRVAPEPATEATGRSGLMGNIICSKHNNGNDNLHDDVRSMVADFERAVLAYGAAIRDEDTEDAEVEEASRQVEDTRDAVARRLATLATALRAEHERARKAEEILRDAAAEACEDIARVERGLPCRDCTPCVARRYFAARARESGGGA